MKTMLVSACLTVLLAACAGGGYDGTRQGRADDMAAIQTRLALAYVQAGDLRQAVAAIDGAVRADRKNEAAWLVRGQIFRLIDNRQEAERSLKQVLRLNPASAEGNNNYGWFLCSAENRPAESLAYFARALADRTYPEPYVAHLNAGICAGKVGEYARAQEHFAAALAVMSDFSPALKASAENHYLAGDYAAAQSRYGAFRSVAAKPSADDILLGWRIARAAGDDSAAADYAGELAAAYPYAAELNRISRKTH
ncbi:type IV pilus biogenesis/stability protein PilW [Neisseria leonii]|uniref:type IV pilus biogenesis/stability protein PilW n=1 Tax=Neisseria leonii TaxID=2995413 RepID=UPI00237A59E2|nr:type IV pilus biogenesis/stability protein PilW [Neisseria sp. 3986]MDD9325298.1 type IV pilus biogenesis/stability protein PilW [Neisseria sp. 3986]